jgi:hypothetical protein
MLRPIVYIAITNHGFGHATRAASIAAELQHRNPNITLILATTAPRSVLEAYIPGPFIHRPRAFDVGAIQSDSITMDLPATLEKLGQIRKQARSVIASEANYLKQNRVGLVLADIPPLAAPIAKAAGVPCWMMGNFGWDFIYRAWGEEFLDIADWMAECFQQCDQLFRLPFHEPMSAFPHITDVGLTGVNPRVPPETIEAEFHLSTTPREQIVLMTFGGMGLNRIPYENLSRFPDWRFIDFNLQAPDYPNLIKVNDRDYRPVDFMSSCGRVVSKPGYSTFSEACRLDLPIVSLIREGFAESPVLLQGLQDYAYHQILTPQEFFEGDWGFLAKPLNPPHCSEPLPKDGTATITQAILDYFVG